MKMHMYDVRTLGGDVFQWAGSSAEQAARNASAVLGVEVEPVPEPLFSRQDAFLLALTIASFVFGLVVFS